MIVGTGTRVTDNLWALVGTGAAGLASCRGGTGGGGDGGAERSLSFPLNKRMKPLLLCFNGGRGEALLFHCSWAASPSQGGAAEGTAGVKLCKAFFAFAPALVERARARWPEVLELTRTGGSLSRKAFADDDGVPVAVALRDFAWACACSKDMSVIVGDAGRSFHRDRGLAGG